MLKKTWFIWAANLLSLSFRMLIIGALRWTGASLYSLHTSVSSGHPWPCHRFTGCPVLDSFWKALTPAYHKHVARPAILKILWPSSLAIYNLQSLRSLRPPSNTLRTDCSHAALYLSPLDRCYCYCNGIISVIHVTCHLSGFNVISNQYISLKNC